MTTLIFSASDGKVTTLQTVQVQVLDVNRAPRIQVANHALVVGQAFRLTVGLGAGSSSAGLVAVDDDGAVQTQGLQVAFTNLPEGASYDAQAKNLDWTPGPAQVGDYVVTANVSDGIEETHQTFTLRVLADATAGAPKILISTTPSTPVQKGQTVLVTVRAQGYSTIETLTVKMRGSGLGSDQWQDVSLDIHGRLRLIPVQPGLVEIEVSAIDQDGFGKTQTHLVRVKDPTDTAAPALAWVGALEGATPHGAPLVLQEPALVQVRIGEAQLMGYELAIAAAGDENWRTLLAHESAATSIDTTVDLLELDPTRIYNGVYKLRVSAWDIVGRTSEIEATVVIDSAQKQLDVESACDRVLPLGGHGFALNRSLETGSGEGRKGGEFGNWRITAFDFKMSHDQPAMTEQGGTAPWQEGARVWLRVPSSLSLPNAPMVDLGFTLGTTEEALGQGPDAPIVRHPAFAESQGFVLQARAAAEEAHDNQLADAVQLQGRRLYDQSTGLPWLPTRFTLVAPDGTRYALDAAGRLSGVVFGDGAQWLVTDAGIVAVGADERERIELLRDAQGRIVRAAGAGSNGERAAIAYRYDSLGRLVLARGLDATDNGTAYAYQPNGKTYPDTINKNLGAALAWTASATSNQWQGTLLAGQTTTVAFSVRESELASTIKVAGALGAVLVAIQVEGAVDTLEVTDAITLGKSSNGGVETTLVRVTEAGLKLVRVTGNGDVTLKVAIAGDVNRDGVVDGADAQAWEGAFQGAGSVDGDIDGDGVVGQKDRQALYANYGFRANQAPAAAASLPVIKTHTDLPGSVALNDVAQDFEGDSVFWRVIDATHGIARLSGDGQRLWFVPNAGYAGPAVVRVQADDGFVAGAVIEIGVEVSGAQLVGLRIEALPALEVGQTARLRVVADFDDEDGVLLASNSGYLEIVMEDLSSLGYSGLNAIQVDAAQGLLLAQSRGPALITVSHTDAGGHSLRTVAVMNVLPTPEPIATNVDDDDDGGAPEPLVVQTDVYPSTLALLPGTSRSIKVIGTDGSANPIHIQYPTSIRCLSSNDSIATVSNAGLITALGPGEATISVVRIDGITDDLGNTIEQALGQSDIKLSVRAAQICAMDPATGATQRVQVLKAQGAALSSSTGETVLIGAGSLNDDVEVGIERIDLNQLQSVAGMTAPPSDALQTLAAFRLELGEDPIASPVQLIIPLQDSTDVQPGDEVYFLKRGTITDAGGVPQDTWWFVDNGHVDQDGTARTASPPYSGVTTTGNYIVSSKSKTNSQTGAITVDAVIVNMPVLWAGPIALGMAAGFGAAGLLGASAMMGVIGIMATMAAPIWARKIEYDGAYQLQSIQRNIDNSGNIHLSIEPSGSSSSGTTAAQAGSPRILGLDVIGGSKLRVQLGGLRKAGASDASLRLKVWLSPDGLTIDTNGNASSDLWDGMNKRTNGILLWVLAKNNVPITSDSQDLEIDIPSDVALSLHVVTVQRMFKDDVPEATWRADGNLVSATIEGDPNFSVVTTGRTIQIIRNGNVVKEIPFVDKAGASLFVGGYKTDQTVFSFENRLMFVAGSAGRIVIVDTALLRIVAIHEVPGSRDNIASLAVSGDWLYAAEGGRYTPNDGGHRLLRINLDETDPEFLEAQAIRLPSSVSGSNAPCGYFDLAISKGMGTHSYMAVTAPSDSIPLDNGKSQVGHVFVVDLNELTMDGATLVAGEDALMVVPFKDNKGKGPQYVAPAPTKGMEIRFVLSNAQDYNAGVSTVSVTVNATGKMLKATANSLVLDAKLPNQTWFDRYANKYRLNIQRSQGAEIVTHEGVEYALVADFHLDFNEPDYWDGTLLGKQIGGKVGIVRDPFGSKSEYLGSTTPILGASIKALAVDASTTMTLWADLVYWEGLPSGVLSWNLVELLKAANENSITKQNTHRPIPVDRDPSTKEQKVTPGKYDFGWVFGMARCSVLKGTSTTTAGGVRLGDIGRIDLIKLIKEQLHEKFGAFADTAFGAFSESTVSLTGEARVVKYKDAAGTEHVLGAGREEGLDAIGAASKKLYPEGDFATSGVMFIAPTFTPAEMVRLRRGERLTKAAVIISVKGITINGTMVTDSLRLEVPLQDFGQPNGASVFFGDRALTNPGYSTFNISGSIGINIVVNTPAIALDVWRVTQRLKYLGFPAMSTAGDNTLKDFEVNGSFKLEHAHAAYLFKCVINYGPGHRHLAARNTLASAAVKRQQFDTHLAAAIEAFSFSAATDNVDHILTYLNAYNAPHWMQLFARTPVLNDRIEDLAVPGWYSSQTFSTTDNVEIYGCSWIYDLMKAKQFAPLEFTGGRKSLFNGVTDANELRTPIMHATHDLGLAMDLGIKDYVNYTYQGPTGAASTQSLTINASVPIGWDNQRALDLSALLPSDVANGANTNNQRDATREFLSLYWVTKNVLMKAGSSGSTTTQRAIVNGATDADKDKIQTALFRGAGAGLQPDANVSLIHSVHIGAPQRKLPNGAMQTANTYPNIHKVLARLSIASTAVRPHEHHFHVYLTPPAPKDIE